MSSKNSQDKRDYMWEGGKWPSFAAYVHSVVQCFLPIFVSKADARAPDSHPFLDLHVSNYLIGLHSRERFFLRGVNYPLMEQILVDRYSVDKVLCRYGNGDIHRHNNPYIFCSCAKHEFGQSCSISACAKETGHQSLLCQIDLCVAQTKLDPNLLMPQQRHMLDIG
ncbi:hypothetical protein BABINDRAFT_183335 [Babjeviella inositovora NRRL Y-12698]|uniref:Uncharacterized protein n=1 Tax=Babjeviella inositovora NRRL Y-12698 TaxID=984486 RepID=A0A1E3QRN2_9ASCO|nr:uncharacterized protein BABINDRAFT_183335 [Babjeviella inositovora NRRL Y-12698]ODQ80320.1 hypothetical protein BABINDRAFT_183335 [Babjeviella inositovora NRRL Y-12698]